MLFSFLLLLFVVLMEMGGGQKSEAEMAEIYFDYTTTPLHSAASTNNMTTLELIFADAAADIRINARNEDGETPLLLAIKSQSLAATKALIDRGALNGTNGVIFVNDKGQSALHYAAIYANVTFVQAILQATGNATAGGLMQLNDLIGNKSTALHYAVNLGKLYIVTQLLECKANIEERDGAFSRTPLLLAARNNNLAMFRLLLDRGASLNNVFDLNSMSAMHLAAEADAVPIMKVLLDRGLPVDFVSAGQTALHRAAIFCKNGSTIDFLIQKGADKNMKGGGVYSKDGFGGAWTPLGCAARAHNLIAMDALIKNGANANCGLEPCTGDFYDALKGAIWDNFKWTELCSNSMALAVARLLKAGANPNQYMPIFWVFAKMSDYPATCSKATLAVVAKMLADYGANFVVYLPENGCCGHHWLMSGPADADRQWLLSGLSASDVLMRDVEFVEYYTLLKNLTMVNGTVPTCIRGQLTCSVNGTKTATSVLLQTSVNATINSSMDFGDQLALVYSAAATAARINTLAKQIETLASTISSGNNFVRDHSSSDFANLSG